MPKRRHSGGVAAVGGFSRRSTTGSAVAPGGGGGAAAVAVPGQEIAAPEENYVKLQFVVEEPVPIVFREGVMDRLDIPLSRSSGEVSRRHELWDRFVGNPRSLSPEEMGELYEYTLRRVNYAYRRYSRSSSNEDAAMLLDRMHELMELDDYIDLRNRIRPREEVLQAMRRIITSEDLIAPVWNSERERMFNSLREMAKRGDREAASRLPQMAWAKAESARRAAIGVISGETDIAKLTRTYGEYCDALEASSPYLADDQKALFQAWKNRWADTVRYAQRRSGGVNITGELHGYTPRNNRRARLPGPSQSVDASGVALLVPSSIASQRLRQHAADLGLRVVSSPAELPDTIRTVVNWGTANTGEIAEGLRARGIRFVNADTGPISDKASALSLLGDLAPRTTRDPEQARRLFGDVVVAKRSSGTTRGGGKEVIDFRTDAALDRSLRYDLFQEFIPDRDEWRVNVLGDKVLTAYSKNAVEGSAPTDLSPQRNYSRLSSLPRGVLEIALEACRRAGVEFAGVDIIRDRRTGRYYVLELNAAPGMSRETLSRLIEELNRQ